MRTMMAALSWGYELMLEAEHRFRIKWGRGIRCCTDPPHILRVMPHHAVKRDWTT